MDSPEGACYMQQCQSLRDNTSQEHSCRVGSERLTKAAETAVSECVHFCLRPSFIHILTLSDSQCPAEEQRCRRTQPWAVIFNHHVQRGQRV